MAERTTGEWEAQQGSLGDWYVHNGDRTIAACIGGTGEESEANARYMAAGREAIDLLDKMVDMDSKHLLTISPYIRTEVIAVIAKAKGQGK